MKMYNEEISAESFEIIWDEVIEKLITNYKIDYPYVELSENAYQDIWDNYVDFRKHCRECYMNNPNGLLDRHKVCACMIYSILKADVLQLDVLGNKQDGFYSIINEDLALTTGLSLLRAFIESSIKKTEMDDDTKRFLLKKFEQGLKYPKVNHGNYRKNFLSELHYTKKEGNYNILSLAHTLFLLETYTKYYV